MISVRELGGTEYPSLRWNEATEPSRLSPVNLNNVCAITMEKNRHVLTHFLE